MKQNNWASIPETIVTSSKNKIGIKEVLTKIEKLNTQYFNFQSNTT